MLTFGLYASSYRKIFRHTQSARGDQKLFHGKSILKMPRLENRGTRPPILPHRIIAIVQFLTASSAPAPAPVRLDRPGGDASAFILLSMSLREMHAGEGSYRPLTRIGGEPAEAQEKPRRRSYRDSSPSPASSPGSGSTISSNTLSEPVSSMLFAITPGIYTQPPERASSGLCDVRLSRP